jgi:hypothetical protein
MSGLPPRPIDLLAFLAAIRMRHDIAFQIENSGVQAVGLTRQGSSPVGAQPTSAVNGCQFGGPPFFE